MVTCYDPEGNPCQKETVDARECVLHCGYTMQPPEAKEELSTEPSEMQSGESQTQEPLEEPTAESGLVTPPWQK